jgi:phosphoribosylformylglycinamidine (FGAM) synthase-like amidotransferase family enzyme
MNACETVLLIGNCSPHGSDHVVTVLTNARVRVITFAPHATHVFQMLDLVLFGALKKRASGLEMWNE